MNRYAGTLFLGLALSMPVLADVAAPSMPGRAWHNPAPRAAALRVEAPAATYRWDALDAKARPATDPRRTAVGVERGAPKSFAAPAWQAVAGGFAARFDVASEGALGLRVRLDLAGAPALEVRVAAPGGGVEAMPVAAGEARAWGPWTSGEVQAVEVFAAERPAEGAVRVGGVVHFDQPLEGKAAGTCTLDTQCSTGDPALDAAIAESKRAIARITFVDGGNAYVCTGTLLDSAQYPTPWFLTATHCIGRDEVAASITSLWFHENSACGAGPVTGSRQVAGGMLLAYADPNTDQTLLRLRNAPPDGAVFAGWNAAKLAGSEAFVSLSHPKGDVAKWAQGTLSGQARFPDWEQAAWIARFSRGLIEGGSSGSGLFTLAGGKLQLRAVLSASTVNAQGSLSCTNTDPYGIYNRFDVFVPEVARHLVSASTAYTPDDYGNTPGEARDVTLDDTPVTLAGRIDYAGDVDIVRITVLRDGTLLAQADGAIDTVGVLLDANGERLDSSDDAGPTTLGYGLTWRVRPGTYYLVTTRWESAGTGDYTIRLSRSDVTDNYTDLWWNRAEDGWGINFNHQGTILFATLFTYDDARRPMWLVMARGERQPDGSFTGPLLRTVGTPFNAVTWGGFSYDTVGTMRVVFTGADNATLTYTVNGRTATKSIERQVFVADPMSCSWSAFDRSTVYNFQDLWYNPAEEGWGINVAHRGKTIFATLFVYGADGQGLWFAMSKGERDAQFARYTGPLYRVSGPAFDTVPWVAAVPTAVGSMTLSFGDGLSGTLTYTVDGVTVNKRIERQVFGSPATRCENLDD